MNIIPSDREDLYAINVFTVRPENQQPVIDTILGAGNPADIPGLLSMHLLRSDDGTTVINHMHWESREAFDSALAGNRTIADTMRRVGALVEHARPGLYEVIEVGS
jgi:heme-degrading monooxygenase HmoA